MSTLDAVLERIRATETPVVVFDLDSTLLSTQERNYVILQEFTRLAKHPELDGAVAGLPSAALGWNVVDDLRGRGFHHEETLGRLRSYWRERFFRDDYLSHDLPLPGAVDFVREAHEHGATIYYLTGRDEPGMGQGTRKSLAAHGFPLDDPRVRLRLKPRFEDEDLAFKHTLFPEIHGLGEVVAAFENEPANANLFAQYFPAAHVFFLETVHSPNPPALSPRVIRLKDFRR